MMKIKKEKRRVALVHDFLLYPGGAEKVLKEMTVLFPDADIFTLLVDQSQAELLADLGFGGREELKRIVTDSLTKEQKVFSVEKQPKKQTEGKFLVTSFLQRFPGWLRRRHRWLMPLMPTAIETLDFRQYDLVISSSSAFAKGIVVKSHVKHISYLHAPMRYVWDWNKEYLEENKLKNKPKLCLRLWLNYLRMWDRVSAERPDYLVANSSFTAQRIKKYYRRSATVIYPPVDVEQFQPSREHDGYFLSVGRLVPYKRFDLLVEVFQKLKLPLVIAGEGPDKRRLQKLIGSSRNIKLVGWLSPKQKSKLFERARAFILATEDDFNIAAVEAMAAGKPVIALEKGGTAETVLEGLTGEFFQAPTVELIADAIGRFKEREKKYDPQQIRARAEEFSVAKFRKNFAEFIERRLVEQS